MGTIFDNPYNKTEIWSAQGALITYAVRKLSDAPGTSASASLLPIVATRFDASYNRALSAVYALNKSADGNMTKLYMAGPPAGRLNFGSMVGPSTAMEKFLQDAGNACNVIDFTVKPFGSVVCATTTASEQKFGATISIAGSIFAGLQISMDPGQGGMAIIQMPLMFEFTQLNWTDGTSSTTV